MSGHAVAVSHPCRQVDNRSVSDPELTESLQHRPDIHYSARSRKDQGTVLTRLQYVVLMQSRDAVYCYMRCGVVCLCLSVRGHTGEPCKTNEPIEMPFGGRSEARGTMYWTGARIPQQEGAIEGNVYPTSPGQ